MIFIRFFIWFKFCYTTSIPSTLWQERCRIIRTDAITIFLMLSCCWATLSHSKCFMVRLLHLHNYCHITSWLILSVSLSNQSKIWYAYKNIMHAHANFTFVIASGQKYLIKVPSVISPFLLASFIRCCEYFISHRSIIYQQFYFSLNGRQNKWHRKSKQRQ